MAITERALKEELRRLLKLFKIPGDSEPLLVIKNLKNAGGRYYPKKRKIAIDIEVAFSDMGFRILRHEFAHFLQHLRGEKFFEKKARHFEVNIRSNYPFYPPKFDLSFEQKKLEEWL